MPLGPWIPLSAALALSTAHDARADDPTADDALAGGTTARQTLADDTTARHALADDMAHGEPAESAIEKAHADARAGDAQRSVASSALSDVAAFIPGVIVHGSGHLVAGDTTTGVRLLAIEGAGLGALAAGFLPIVFSGASRRLVGPGAALTVAGVGLFAISFLADVYGVVAPRGGFGAPSRVTPDIETAIGYRYVYNPEFAYRQFLVQEIDYRTGPWRLHPSAWFALDDTNSRLRADFAYRLSGPMPEGQSHARDGSFLDIDAALTRHAFTSDRFATTTGEMAIAGRLDMARVGPSLRGSFAELSLGWATQAYAYSVRGTTADVGELLLARFGYGMYIGWRGAPRGEVTLYYDHRHDDFAAGLKIPGLGSGVAGHFGAQTRVLMSDHFGIAAEAVAGSAYVVGLSLLFRQGEPL
jgi:hypothetical protein